MKVIDNVSLRWGDFVLSTHSHSLSLSLSPCFIQGRGYILRCKWVGGFGVQFLKFLGGVGFSAFLILNIGTEDSVVTVIEVKVEFVCVFYFVGSNVLVDINRY